MPTRLSLISIMLNAKAKHFKQNNNNHGSYRLWNTWWSLGYKKKTKRGKRSKMGGFNRTTCLEYSSSGRFILYLKCNDQSDCLVPMTYSNISSPLNRSISLVLGGVRFKFSMRRRWFARLKDGLLLSWGVRNVVGILNPPLIGVVTRGTICSPECINGLNCDSLIEKNLLFIARDDSSFQKYVE